MAENSTLTPAAGRMRLVVSLSTVMLIAIVNIVDRNIIIILQEPIKRELRLSDSQLGLLTGLSFAIVYTLCSFPLARLADTWVRKRVIALSLIVWSALTAISSLAGSFPVLVACRMGVAAGEAGATPASHSLISDYFPPDRRVTALAVWSLSVPIGTMLGYAAGGWLAAAMGWRLTFAVLGAGGMLLAPLALLLIHEPRRGVNDPEPSGLLPALSARAATIALWSNLALRRLVCAAGLQGFVLFGLLAWSAPFYMRSHAMALERTASLLSLVIGLAGGAGVLAGAWAARQLGRYDGRWYMWILVIGDACFVPLLIVQVGVHDVATSLIAGAFAIGLAHLFIAIVVAQAHAIVAPTLRATASATLGFAVSVVGLGIGPLLIGLGSDMLSARGFGSGSLAYAMLILAPAAIAAAWFCLRVAASLPRDISLARS